MKITLTGEESLRIEPTPGPLTFEAASSDRSYSPFHMLGSALGVHKTLTHSIEISVDAVGTESPAIEAAL